MGRAGEKEKQTKKSSTVRETAKKNSMGKAKTAAGILAAAEQIAPMQIRLPLIFEFVFNTLVYAGAKIIAGGWHHYNIETKLDLAIPFLPWTIVMYFGCYLFWAANYVLSVRGDASSAWRFLSADFLAKCVCLFFLSCLSDDKYKTGGDRKFGLGRADALFVPGFDAQIISFLDPLPDKLVLLYRHKKRNSKGVSDFFVPDGGRGIHFNADNEAARAV